MRALAAKILFATFETAAGLNTLRGEGLGETQTHSICAPDGMGVKNDTVPSRESQDTSWEPAGGDPAPEVLLVSPSTAPICRQERPAESLRWTVPAAACAGRLRCRPEFGEKPHVASETFPPQNAVCFFSPPPVGVRCSLRSSRPRVGGTAAAPQRPAAPQQRGQEEGPLPPLPRSGAATSAQQIAIT